MVFDAPSKVFAPPEDEPDEPDESVEDDYIPFQLFGTKCESWDDVVAALKESPELLERFFVFIS
jgi:hypothetical protein